MPVDQVSEQAPPPIDRTTIAGFWRRLAAFLIDSIILGVPTLLLGLAFFQWAANLGQAGRLVGFVAALVYFGVLNSRIGGGQTLGKRLLGIRVTDRAGEALSLMRSSLRFLVLAIPYFLNGLWFDVNTASVGVLEFLFGVLLAFIVFGGLGAIVYLIIFNRRTRQSLHDLAIGSFVVRGRPKAVPLALATPRLHIILVGLWLALALIVPGAVVLAAREPSGQAASLTSLVELQEAIRTQPGVRQVKIQVGQRSVATVRTGRSTTTFLRVDVQAGDGRTELDALSSAIASMVLERYPNLLGRQVLVVGVRRGFDLGIARWSLGRQEALDAATWRQRLTRLPAQP